MLRIENLSVSYGEALILRDVDLEIETGRSGLPDGPQRRRQDDAPQEHYGAVAPRRGRVLVGGRDDARDLTRAGAHVRAHCGIGYVPQGREIFPQLTVRENLQIGLTANPPQVANRARKGLRVFPHAA